MHLRIIEVPNHHCGNNLVSYVGEGILTLLMPIRYLLNQCHDTSNSVVILQDYNGLNSVIPSTIHLSTLVPKLHVQLDRSAIRTDRPMMYHAKLMSSHRVNDKNPRLEKTKQNSLNAQSFYTMCWILEKIVFYFQLTYNLLKYSS